MSKGSLRSQVLPVQHFVILVSSKMNHDNSNMKNDIRKAVTYEKQMGNPVELRSNGTRLTAAPHLTQLAGAVLPKRLAKILQDTKHGTAKL
jgi:hypothetical protein